MRRHKIAISRRARNMIKGHVRFLAQVNISAGEKLEREILADIRSLQEMPERFPLLDPDKRDGYRKMVAAGRYPILYLVIDGVVYVEYVVDGRQDYKWLIP